MKRTDALLLVTGTLVASALVAVGLTSVAPPAEPQVLAAPAATSTSFLDTREEVAAERASRSQKRAQPTQAPAPTQPVAKKSSAPAPAAAKKTPNASTQPKPAPKPKPAAAKSPAGDAAILACIRKHESGGNYRAVNASGKYRGAYQMDRGYAPVWAKRAGFGEWSGKTPDQWPPSVQDAVAYDMGHGNRYAAWRNFTSYSCPW